MKYFKRMVALVILVCSIAGCRVQEEVETLLPSFSEVSIHWEDKEDLPLQRNLAMWYNYHLVQNHSENEARDAYESILFYEDGIMGVLEIQSLSVPIYHGIAEDTLRKGCGHFPNSAFPIGRNGETSVLVMEGIKMPETGCEFSISLLGEKIVYRITASQTQVPYDFRSLNASVVLIVRNGREETVYFLCDRVVEESENENVPA